MRVFTLGVDGSMRDALSAIGFHIEDTPIATPHEEIVTWLKDGQYDAGVLDLEKSGLNLQIVQQLRIKKIVLPIIGIANGRTEEVRGDTRALFLEAGGDDLLHFPVNPRELAASLRAIARRCGGIASEIVEISHKQARLKINLSTKEVLLNGKRIPLTIKQTELLLILAATPGRTITRGAMLTRMYMAGVDHEPTPKVIDVYLSHIRKKFRAVHPNGHELIETVWGHGHRLREHSVAVPKLGLAA